MGRVLITGAAGGVGTFLMAGLPAYGWQPRGFDRRLPDPTGSDRAASGVGPAAAGTVSGPAEPGAPSTPGPASAGPDGSRAAGSGAAEPAPAGPGAADFVVGDIRDPAALDAALDGVSAVVHLAGVSLEARFPDLIGPNIEGTYQVFEAARRAGIERVIYASSNHVVGYSPRTPLAGIDLRPRPDTFYGATKVFGEALASLYVDRHGMRIACVRIGSCFERPATERHLSTWLSPGDANRLFHACLTAPDLTYAVLYGISANTRGWWDLASARALGYQPQDDSEVYAAEVLAECGPLADDDPDAVYLGGRFTIAKPIVPDFS